VLVILVEGGERLVFDYEDITIEGDRAMLETGEGRSALEEGQRYAEGDYDPLPQSMRQ
jgi:hypothetical protein